MKKTIKNRTSRNWTGSSRKTFYEVSQTIQGETLTIGQIFQRAQQQGAFPGHGENEPNYLDVEDIDQINHMYKQGLDLVDIHEHAKHIKEQNELVNKLEIKHKQALKAQQLADHNQAIIDKYKASEAEQKTSQKEQKKEG